MQFQPGSGRGGSDPVVGGRAAEGIIAKAVKDLLRVVAKDAERDALKAAERDALKAAEKDALKAAEQDLTKDTEKDLATSLDKRVLDGDPVDVVTGDVVFRQVDVDLPGLLPLVLSRTHVSSFRAGTWFGPSWASTLDQRLEVLAAEVRYTGEDGAVLVYPRAADGAVSGLPRWGARWPVAGSPDRGFTVTDPERGRTAHFSRTGAAVWSVSAVTDRNGNRIDIDRDARGAPVAVRHSGGYHVTVATEDGLVTGLGLAGAGAGAELVRFSYGPGRRLVRVVNSSGLPLRLAYDDDGRLVRWEDRNGGWYRYRYDADGRCVQGTGAGGFLDRTFSYHPAARVSTVTDSLGSTRELHYNHLHQVVREVDPLGQVTVSEWDRDDRLLARTDPLGRTVRYSYDADGNLVAIVRPDGEQVTARYNRQRLPVEVTEPGGATWRRDYDERGNLTALVDPAGATTRYTYTGAGHLAGVTDALGGARRVRTDAAGLPVEVTDASGATTVYSRDAFGRVNAITDPLGGVTRLGWTVEGRLAWRVQPDGATDRWSHDAEGNLTGHQNPAGQTNLVQIGPFDLPAARVGPAGARTAYRYDTELRPVAVTNPQGLVWQYGYDAAGRLVRESDFNGRVHGYRYDPAGQLTERTNGAGQTVTLRRDWAGRVVEQRHGEQVSTFGYDLAGRLVRAANADAEIVLARDALGRVTADTCNGRTVSSQYDPLGRRTLRRTPSGALSRWAYDADDRPVALDTGGQTLRFGYDQAGREVARRLSAEVLLTQTWGPQHQLLTQTLTAGGLDPAAPGGQPRLVQHRGYGYRPDGYLTGIRDHLGGDRGLELDPTGRITAVHRGEGPERYAYDPAGNLTYAAWPAGSEPDAAAQGERTYAGTLIRHAGAVRYQHDGQGRVVLRQRRLPSAGPQTWHYGWDVDDRLIGVSTPDGTRWRYRYDPLGRRIAKQRLARDGTVAEQVDFAWDGPVLAERRGGDRAVAWDFQPGTFRAVAQTERRADDQHWYDERFYAIVTDLVGTPTELIAPDGTLGWRRNASVWGLPLGPPGSAGPADCPLRFPGQYADPETGLDYNYFRYYDPATARYSSGDPLGLAPAANPHSYIRNPTAWADPLGLNGCTPASRTLNLGSGDNPMPGAVNVDSRPLPGVDVVADAEHLPFKSGSFSDAHAVNPYGFQPVNPETARVLEPGGRLTVTGSPRNPYVNPTDDQVAAAGFRKIYEGPMVPGHEFGVQKFTDGRSIFAGNSLSKIYELL
jgi:RHS repeat-associated protein